MQGSGSLSHTKHTHRHKHTCHSPSVTENPQLIFSTEETTESSLCRKERKNHNSETTPGHTHMWTRSLHCQLAPFYQNSGRAVCAPCNYQRRGRVLFETSATDTANGKKQTCDLFKADIGQEKIIIHHPPHWLFRV